MRRLNRIVLTITISVKSNKKADQLVASGIRLGEKKLRVERYTNSRQDIICGRYLG